MKNTLRFKHFIKSLLVLIGFAQAGIYAQPVKQWEKTLGSNGIDVPTTVRQTSDGGYILGGFSDGKAGYDMTTGAIDYGDLWIVKLAPDGSKQWDKTISAYNADIDCDIIQTKDGGYIIASSSGADMGWDKSENSKGSSDFWIIKLSANGTKQWDKTIGGTGYEEASTIRQTPDGGYIIGGYSNSPAGGQKTENSRGKSDYWLVKISSTGTKEWDKTIGSSGSESISSLELTKDNGFIIGGTSSSSTGADKSEASVGGNDYWVVKLASDGSKMWDKTYGSEKNEELYSIIESAEGGYIMTGLTRYTDHSNPDGSLIIKIASNGTRQWEKILGGAGNYENNRLIRIQQDSNGNYLLCGYTNFGIDRDVSGPEWSDAYFVKLENDGTKIWDINFNEIADNQLTSFQITSDGGFILGGTTYSDHGVDYWLVKLAPEKAPTPVTTRINAGGLEFTTDTKQVFSGDQYYAGIDRTSSVPSADILNTGNDVLYRSGRCSPSFSYNVPVVNGTIDVVLHFAETYFGAPGKKGGKGSRQFHVNMEGSRKLTNFDIFAAAGGALRAYQTTIPVIVTDGVLNIDFLSGAADMPRVSAIEVLPFQQRTLTFTPDADATVQGGSYQNQNFGSDPYLNVKRESGDLLRTSYLRFAIPGVQYIKSAKLRIYGHNHQSSGSYVIAAGGVLNDYWTENGITFSNAPTWLNPTQQARARVGGEWAYAELDVTEFVKSDEYSADEMVSFALTGAGQRLVFHSKENPSGFVPQLVIVTEDMMNLAARLGNETEDEPKAEAALNSVIYPNPAKDYIMLDVSSGHKSEVDLKLTNMTGHLFQLQRAETEGSSSKLKVSLPDKLPAGIYLLKVQSKEFSEVIKVLLRE